VDAHAVAVEESQSRSIFRLHRIRVGIIAPSTLGEALEVKRSVPGHIAGFFDLPIIPESIFHLL